MAEKDIMLVDVIDRIDALTHKTAVLRLATEKAVEEIAKSDPELEAGLYAHACEIEAELKNISRDLAARR